MTATTCNAVEKKLIVPMTEQEAVRAMLVFQSMGGFRYEGSKKLGCILIKDCTECPMVYREGISCTCLADQVLSIIDTNHHNYPELHL